MYQPPHFREDRIDVIHDLMRAHPFTTLVSLQASGQRQIISRWP